MTSEELRHAHHRLGLTARRAADIFRVSGHRTVQKWWSGERGIPGPVEVLTEALIESKSVRNFFGLELAE
jgi:hypothetical protein